MKIMIDGQIRDSSIIEIDALSQGFQYGFGLFETLKLVEGEPEYFHKHMDRLKASMDFLGMKIVYSRNQVLNQIHDLVKHVERNQTILKIAVHKGLENDLLVMTTRENKYSEADYEAGFHLRLAEGKRNQYSKLTYHKTLNYMENLVERQNRLSGLADEIIFLNVNDHIAEGSVSNIFWIKDGELYTPSVKSGILNGIMRQVIIDKAKNNGLLVHECERGINAIKTADAVFLSNSIMGIMPVSDFENTCYSRENGIMNFLRNG